MTIPTDAELLSLLDRLDSVPADALESQYLDFKSWREAKQELRVACEYAACFANADGGVIVFGVDDKTIGRAAAIHGAGGFDLDTFQRGIYQGTRPSLSVQVSVLNVPEGTGQLLVVRVPAQITDGRRTLRHGSGPLQATRRQKLHAIKPSCVCCAPNSNRYSGLEWRSGRRPERGRSRPRANRTCA